MATLAISVVLLLAAATLLYLLLERHPVYGKYYGLAKLMGARLDVGPVDWATLQRRRWRNDALACPAGHCPNADADFEAQTYPVPPDALLARLRKVALSEPGTTELATDCADATRFVQRTRLMRYPDTIDAQVLPAGDGRSTLAIYSRSLVGKKDFGVNHGRLTRWLAALPVAGVAMGVLLSTAPAGAAERWFGSVFIACDTFADCGVWPDMPEPPSDPASVILRRAGKANAPLRIEVSVNKPVEGGTPIVLNIGERVFALQPGSDVLTRRATFDGIEREVGYDIAQARVAELVAAMRGAARGKLSLAVAGASQERAIQLDGMEAALRFMDERQGRLGAADALIEPGARAAADAVVPEPLPGNAALPTPIRRILRREKCEDRLTALDALTVGYIAQPAPGRALWQIACWGGNYNILFILLDVRNGDPRTARLLTFETRTGKAGRASVLVNPVWWDDRKEIWAFERGRSFGDCGTVARYRWTERGFTLIDERYKEDCDDKFVDPWTAWPVTKRGRKLRSP